MDEFHFLDGEAKPLHPKNETHAKEIALLPSMPMNAILVTVEFKQIVQK